MAKILIGISSWAEPELIKTGFYPADIKTPADRLKYYASHFSIAEIDSTYHFFPSRHNLELWLNNTPDGFKFNIRAFSLFTGHPTQFASLPGAIREKYGHLIKAKSRIYPHHLPTEATEELWKIFNRNVEQFSSAGKLGTVFFQFPPWFHPEPANFDILAQHREKLTLYRMAVEFRTPDWMEHHREKTLDFLRDKNISLVCVDEPQDCKSCVPPVAEVTASPALIRFHGRNAGNWERYDMMATEKFNYLYEETELKEWVPKIKGMAKKAAEVHIIFKNKHQDFPVKNAFQMRELLGLT